MPIGSSNRAVTKSIASWSPPTVSDRMRESTALVPVE